MGPLILHLTFTLERYGVHVFIGPVDSKFISAFISFMVHAAEADCESIFFADPPEGGPRKDMVALCLFVGEVPQSVGT
jgi:hypothetical protein